MKIQNIEDTGFPETGRKKYDAKVSPENLSQAASGLIAVSVTPSFMPAAIRKDPKYSLEHHKLSTVHKEKASLN